MFRGSYVATYISGGLLVGKPLFYMPTYDEYLYISECAQTIYLNGMLLLTVVYALTKYLKRTVTCYSIVSTLPLKWCGVCAQHLSCDTNQSSSVRG